MVPERVFPIVPFPFWLSQQNLLQGDRQHLITLSRQYCRDYFYWVVHRKLDKYSVIVFVCSISFRLSQGQLSQISFVEEFQLRGSNNVIIEECSTFRKSRCRSIWSILSLSHCSKDSSACFDVKILSLPLLADWHRVVGVEGAWPAQPRHWAINWPLDAWSLHSAR